MPCTANCPNCGAPVPAPAVAGLCRKCLVLRWAGGLSALDGDSAGESASVASPSDATHTFERSFGNYELLGEIARGGMGVVHRARQRTPSRIVALKMIGFGRLASDAEVKRFRLETEAVARLEHPHIVPIHDVGEHDGRPYFTMQLIEGGSLAERISNREAPISNREAAGLIATVARAIRHAHARGILHRDLKPANILLDAHGAPHVTDFGLAKRLPSESEIENLTSEVSLTLTGTVLGTPSYMAPEQAAGKNKEVTTAADIYSLGAILYELLAGQPPFQADTPLETLRKVVEEEPVPPGRLAISDLRFANGKTEGRGNRKSKMVNSVDRDLETICLKCLQKNPAHRYSTAEELAEDLERWLRHEPIRARPSSAWERGVKWMKRHPARAGLGAFALVAPAIIITLLLVTSLRVTRERNLADEQRNHARQAQQEATDALARAEIETRRADAAAAETRENLYAADMLLAQHALDDGNLALARRLVEAHRPAAAGIPPAATSPDLRGFEWRYSWQRCQGDQRQVLHGHSNAVSSVAFSRDGKTVASGDDRGVVKFWDVATRRLTTTLATGQTRLLRVSFSPDGQFLAAADANGRANIWNLATRTGVWTHLGRYSQGVDLSSTGNRIGFSWGTLTGRATNAVARVVEWTTGKELLRVAPWADFESFSGDGKLAFFARARPHGSEIWDLETGRKVRTIPNYAPSLLLSPNGRFLVGLEGPFTETDEILLFDLAEDQPPARLRVANRSLNRLAFSPDSTVLASAGTDQMVRLWDVATQRQTGRLLGHVNHVTDLAFSPDGQLLATSSADQSVILWPLAAKHSAALTNAWFPLVLSPDGTKLASLDQSEGARKTLLWDLATRHRTVLSQPGELWQPEFFSADSQTLFARGEVTAEGDLPLRRWSVASLTPSGTTLLHLGYTNIVGRSAVTPDGNIYSVSQQGIDDVSLWNPVTGEKVMEFRYDGSRFLGMPIRFSTDGRLLAMHAWPNAIRLIDRSAPDHFLGRILPVTHVHHVSFSPNGKTLAAACSDHTIRLLDTTTLKENAMLTGHQEQVGPVAFSPDGRTLASCSKDGTVKLWSLRVRREVATVIRGAIAFHYLAFTPDGNTLLAGDTNGRVHFFRAPTLAEIDAKP